MEGRRLILNGDIVLEDCWAGYAEGFLWCYLNGYTIQQAAGMFFDPSNTEHIEFQYGEMSDSYDGFTNCIRLMSETGGMVSVCLLRGADNAAS